MDSLDTGADNSLSVVVLTRINDVVKEDHFVFMSKNLKHNILFVEICNSIIHKYYTDKEIEKLNWTLSLIMVVPASLSVLLLLQIFSTF